MTVFFLFFFLTANSLPLHVVTFKITSVQMFNGDASTIKVCCFISPCHECHDDGTAHEERRHRGFGLAVDGRQQHHHGDHACHGRLPKDGARELAFRLEDVEGCTCGVFVMVRRGRGLLEDFLFCHMHILNNVVEPNARYCDLTLAIAAPRIPPISWQTM